MTIVQTGRLTATEAGHRNQISANMASDGSQLGVVQGVQNGLVLTKTSGMGWQLDLGRCSIAPATPANGGVIATVTVAETGTFANGDATRDRIDVVGLQIDETATIANGNPAVKSVIIQGAYPVSGQPVTPTVPAGTIGLWSVRINANTSAGSGGWNTANLVDIRTMMQRRFHAEYTSTLNVPSGSNYGVGTLALDSSAVTENNGFSSVGAADFVNILQDGIYSVGVIHVPAGPPGAQPSYALIRKNATNGQVLGQGQTSGSLGSYELGAQASNVSLKAGDSLKFFCVNNSGSTQSWANRVFITKIQ